MYIHKHISRLITMFYKNDCKYLCLFCICLSICQSKYEMSKFRVTTGTSLVIALSKVREFMVIAKKLEQKRETSDVKVNIHEKTSQCRMIILHNLLLLWRAHEYFTSVTLDLYIEKPTHTQSLFSIYYSYDLSAYTSAYIT